MKERKRERKTEQILCIKICKIVLFLFNSSVLWVSYRPSYTIYRILYLVSSIYKYFVCVNHFCYAQKNEINRFLLGRYSLFVFVKKFYMTELENPLQAHALNIWFWNKMRLSHLFNLKSSNFKKSLLLKLSGWWFVFIFNFFSPALCPVVMLADWNYDFILLLSISILLE